MSDWQRRGWDQQGSPAGWGGPHARPQGPAPQHQQQRGPQQHPQQASWTQQAQQPRQPGRSQPQQGQSPQRPRQPAAPGVPRSSLVVGAVVGLLVGAAGFFVLAPAEEAEAGGGSGTTVTTSAGAGGTEGDAAAEGQAGSPEEQAVFDLAEAFNNQDCETIVATTEPGLWTETLGIETGDEEEALPMCQAAFDSGQVGGVRIIQSWVIGANSAGTTDVAAINRGWPVNRFTMRQEDGTWRIYAADMDGGLTEEGAAESETEEELENGSGRPTGDPTEPPAGDGTFGELAQNCHAGLMVACDDLSWVAPRGSEHELYGITCGGRRIGVFAAGQCELDFGRQIDEDAAAD